MTTNTTTTSTVTPAPAPAGAGVTTWYPYKEGDLARSAESFCAKFNLSELTVVRHEGKIVNESVVWYPDTYKTWSEETRTLYEIRFRHLIHHADNKFFVDKTVKDIMKYK
jgi:hypothetical protein